MNSENRISVSATHTFRASAEQVFDAFLDPAKAARFMFVTPTGEIVRWVVRRGQVAWRPIGTIRQQAT